MFQRLRSIQTKNGIDAPRFLSMIVQDLMIHGRPSSDRLARCRSLLHSIIPPEHAHGVGITLYEPARNRIRVVRQRKGFWDNLINATRAVRAHPRFSEFDLISSTRIQLDFFGFVERNIEFSRIRKSFELDSNFEFGIDGLRICASGRDYYFLPGDCYVRSILGLDQLRRYLKRLANVDDLGNCAMDRLRSTSFVSFGDEWLPLYRGHPILDSITIPDLEKVCKSAVDNIILNFRPDGRFMYYYDAGRNSHVDHEHPDRDPVKDPYYNELRHCGGIITLLLAYQRDPQPEVLATIERAITFLEEISRTYETCDGEIATHLVYNRKSKLGGSGLALYVLVLFRTITGKRRHDRVIHQLANHIISEISITGEFRYYKMYLDEFVKWEENSNYFSFYYPGEALIGLALYLQWMSIEIKRVEIVSNKIHSALRFLLFKRPSEYATCYQSLPSDAWLMSAINEFWNIPEFQSKSYASFVFEDADRMIAQMYSENNALFPDYVGGFYYNYGDFPYTDGARCEGIVAALSLAEKMQDNNRISRYVSALIEASRATVLLANTPESLYFAHDSKKALGGVRFKLTRQWFRIDTIQHVVCYYYRFIDIYKRNYNNNCNLWKRPRL